MWLRRRSGPRSQWNDFAREGAGARNTRSGSGHAGHTEGQGVRKTSGLRDDICKAIPATAVSCGLVSFGGIARLLPGLTVHAFKVEMTVDRCHE